VRILVTGGNGFIGSAVVRALARGGHEVVCLLRETSRTERIDGVPYRRAIGDVRDAASVKAAAEGASAIIHLASLSAWDQIDSPLMDDVVVKGTANVLAAAEARPGTRVVFVSSILAINGSDGPTVFDERSAWSIADGGQLNYSRCKRAAEAQCAEAGKRGVDVVVCNPGEVYGPEDTSFITACNLLDFAKSSPVLVCTGGTLVAYVDDVADGVVLALEKGRAGERYILGGENLSVEQLARLTLDLLGGKQAKKSILKMPNGLVKALARIGRALHVPMPFNVHVIPYATKFWFMDSSKARRELGASFRPARECLEPTLRWLSQSGHIA
jgi:dihydroflavonol-4-reductase